LFRTSVGFHQVHSNQISPNPSLSFSTQATSD
jgi:hypothetical protein